MVVKRSADGLTRCRICGCTEIDACNPPCGWVEEGLCSTCWQAVAALLRHYDDSRKFNMAGIKREFDAEWREPRLSLILDDTGRLRRRKVCVVPVGR
jgi:hypothetical protein